MKGETGSTLEVGKSDGIVDQMQGCRHNVPIGATWGSSGIPPGSGAHGGYIIPGRAPNDPPETWLDRTARAAMGGLIASAFDHLAVAENDEGPVTEGAKKIMKEIGQTAYMIAEAMLAEKMRREKKEVEE